MLPARYLIGVDSDGTAFDSMNIKHLDAFIPAALEIWPMGEACARRFTEIEKTVNLFSSLRGINRFPGLREAIDCLKEDKTICEALGEHVLTQYVEGKEKEWDAYRTHVSQWEIDRYIVMY